MEILARKVLCLLVSRVMLAWEPHKGADLRAEMSSVSLMKAISVCGRVRSNFPLRNQQEVRKQRQNYG